MEREYYRFMFEYFKKNYRLYLAMSEMEDIIEVVNKTEEEKTMVYLHFENCSKCGKEFQACNQNDTCFDCKKIEDQKKYKKYMIDIRDGKTLEQRIEQIEEWIYKNYDSDHQEGVNYDVVKFTRG